MTWQFFLRTLTIAALGGAGLVFTSQARAEGGEGSSVVSMDEAGAPSQQSALSRDEPEVEAEVLKKPARSPARTVAKTLATNNTASVSEHKTPSTTEKLNPVVSAARQDGREDLLNVDETASLAVVVSAARPKARQSDAIRAGALKSLIARYAAENSLPVELADAVIRLESRYNAGARNGPNVGLTQINVRTARSLGYRGEAAGLFDAETNLRFGLKYLAQAYKLAGGDTCGTILRYQFGHRTQTMTSASRVYCSKVKTLIAAAD